MYVRCVSIEPPFYNHTNALNNIDVSGRCHAKYIHCATVYNVSFQLTKE